MKLDYWARRLWHFSGAIFPLTLWLFPQTRSLLLVGIGILFLAVLFGEIVRFAYPPLNDWLVERLKGALKEDERNKPTGTFYFLLSTWTCIFFFSSPVAAAAVLDLTFGDQAASWVGKKWGRRKWGTKEKSWVGSLACFLVCGLINLIILPWWAALGGALGATLVEALFPWKDDNLTVPLGAALVMQTLLLVF